MKVRYLLVIAFVIIGALYLPRLLHRPPAVFAQLAKLSRPGEHRPIAEVLTLPEGSTCLLVSNIRSQRSSLMRIMNEWSKQGYIKDFVLQSPSLYLFFLGNIIAEGSHTLDVLQIVATLMERNPARVWYIRGPQEKNEAWLTPSRNAILAREMADSDALRTLLRQFFTSMPQGIYLYGAEQTIPLRLSYQGADDPLLTRIVCQSVDDPIHTATCRLNDPCTFAQGPIAAYIIGDDTTINWTNMQGLFFSAHPPTWHIVSSSTMHYKQTYRFFDDAYALLTIKSPLEKSTITYFHTTEKEQVFRQGDTFTVLGTKS